MAQSGEESAATSAASGRGMNSAPAMLIRTLHGHITMWSPAMGERYGFTPGEAMGKLAHQLLRTLFWKSQHEIEAVLVERKSWNGGFIHRHADGRALLTAHRWLLHDSADGNEPMVSELHSDISVADECSASVLADIIGSVGHELSQPLTAISNYISGANRALQSPSSRKAGSNQPLTNAAEQLARIREGMMLFRELSEMLRVSSVRTEPPTEQRQGIMSGQEPEASHR